MVFVLQELNFLSLKHLFFRCPEEDSKSFETCGEPKAGDTMRGYLNTITEKEYGPYQPRRLLSKIVKKITLSFSSLS